MPTVVTYDLIEPNLAEVDVATPMVTVTWKCPVSGKVVGQSNARMTPVAATTNSRATAAAKRAVVREGIGGLLGFISRTFGSTAGKIGGAAAFAIRTGADANIARPVFNSATEHKAVVEAFKAVESKFRWDEDRELYVSVASA